MAYLAPVEHKAVQLAINPDGPGQFTARIATLNVVDKQGDVTLPGAFPQGKEIPISYYGHESWNKGLTVGKAVIRETGNDALGDGEFNLNMSIGRDHYEMVKFAPHLQQWSYGYKVLDGDDKGQWEGKSVRLLKKLDVFEISPVLEGAGIGTTTLAIKSQGWSALPYSQHLEQMLIDVKALYVRTKERVQFRKENGRSLSQADGDRLAEMYESLAGIADDIKALINEGDRTEAGTAEARRLFVEYTKQQALLRASK